MTRWVVKDERGGSLRMSVVGFAKCCRDIPSGNRVGDAVIVIKGKDLRDSLHQALRIFGHHIQGDDRISVRGTQYGGIPP